MELEALGAVKRTHGGVRRVPARGAPLPFSLRAGEHQEVKLRLAAAAAALVEEDQSLVLDSGTTALAVARELAGRSLTVLALSLHAAAALAESPQTRVVVPGGTVAAGTLAFEGSRAVDELASYRADVAIIGACSASAQDGLTSTSPEDARLKRACLAAASRVVLVSTPDKLERTSSFRFAGLGEIDVLVTTPEASAEARAAFEAAGVQVVLSEPAPADAT